MLQMRRRPTRTPTCVLKQHRPKQSPRGRGTRPGQPCRKDPLCWSWRGRNGGWCVKCLFPLWKIYCIWWKVTYYYWLNLNPCGCRRTLSRDTTWWSRRRSWNKWSTSSGVTTPPCRLRAKLTPSSSVSSLKTDWKSVIKFIISDYDYLCNLMTPSRQLQEAGSGFWERRWDCGDHQLQGHSVTGEENIYRLHLPCFSGHLSML